MARSMSRFFLLVGLSALLLGCGEAKHAEKRADWASSARMEAPAAAAKFAPAPGLLPIQQTPTEMNTRFRK